MKGKKGKNSQKASDGFFGQMSNRGGNEMDETFSKTTTVGAQHQASTIMSK